MANKREIVELVQYRIEDETGRFLGSNMLEKVLTAANYFDLLEVAQDMIKVQLSVLNNETCEFKWCKCGGIINLNVRYSDKCVYCRIEDILRKAGVNVE